MILVFLIGNGVTMGSALLYAFDIDLDFYYFIEANWTTFNNHFDSVFKVLLLLFRKLLVQSRGFSIPFDIRLREKKLK